MSRQGQLLIAHPNLPVSNPFSKTVIYVAHDNEQGVNGLVLNKPTNYSVTEFFQRRRLDFMHSGHRMRSGGPVNPTSVYLLHTNDWESASSVDVGQGLSVTSDDFMLEKLSMGYLLLLDISSIVLCSF